MILTYLIIIVGVVSLVASIYRWREENHIRREGTLIQGEILELHDNLKNGKGTRFYIRYGFTLPDGQSFARYERVTRVAYAHLKTLRRLPIRYLPASPDKMRSETNYAYYTVMNNLRFGAMVLLIGVISLLV